MSILVLTVQIPLAAATDKLKDKYKVAKVADQMISEDLLEGSYYREISKYSQMPPANGEIILLPTDSTRSDGKIPETGIYESEDGIGRQAILWTDSVPMHKWDVSVPADGMYCIEFSYVAIEESLEIIYGIMIDGEYPFREAESIRLRNGFRQSGPPEENEYGDQYPIELEHVGLWQDYYGYDIDGIFTQPLLFYLDKGAHSFSMVYKSGEIALSSVRLAAPPEYAGYEEYAEDPAYPPYNGDSLRYEAENADLRSRRILTSEANSDPSVSPFIIGRRTQNVLNGWNYRQGNDEVSWIVDVPVKGKYQLALRVWQNYYPGNVVYRQLQIDGKVPFKEAENMPVEGTGQNFDIISLGGDSPYLLNLDKGKHTITLRTVMGELMPVYYELLQSSTILNNILLDVQTITGSRPDPNMNYRIEIKAPWIIEKIEEVSRGLVENAESLTLLGGKTSEMITSMYSSAGDLMNMKNKPREITRKMSTLNAIQGQIGGWISTLRDSPLMMDYIELLTPESRPVNPKVSLFTRFKVLIAEFINSFRKNEKLRTVDKKDEKIIEIWTAREREFGEIIQQLANEKFTPESGIKVKVNILEAGSVGVVNNASPLTLALVSGETPDVVLGSDSITPVELAIRKSSYDISKFSDFKQVIERFPRGAMIPFEYKGGTYALPDTMDFSLMFYRSDILNSIGIEVPRTWDELIAQTLPALQQYSLNFMINNSANKSTIAASDILFQFLMFYTQRGGKLYKAGNLNSTLDSDLAYQCFKQYTDLYTRSNIAYGQNFYNQFNIGRIPLAIGGFYDYLQLDVAAPGIYGKWEIAPVPGTAGDDGKVSRSVCGTVTSSMLFDGNGKAQQAWDFLKWWTEDDLQIEFSQTLESTIGPQARWFSANSNALLGQGWSAEAKEAIRSMLESYTNVPNILGGYMTNRSMTNAFIRVVINESQKPRDAIEQSYKEIFAEITRKNREYGVIE